jgi:hypothetical protein
MVDKHRNNNLKKEYNVITGKTVFLSTQTMTSTQNCPTEEP